MTIPLSTTPSTQLIRKSNDSRSRTHSSQHLSLPVSSNKRPLSVFQLDLKRNPIGIQLSSPSSNKSRQLSSVQDLALQAHPNQALSRQSSKTRPLDGMTKLSSLRTEMEARRGQQASRTPHPRDPRAALLKPPVRAPGSPKPVPVASLGAIGNQSAPAQKPGASSISLLKLVSPVPPLSVLSKPGTAGPEGARKAFDPKQLSAAALRPARVAKATQALKAPVPVWSAETKRAMATVSPSKRRAPGTGSLASRARLIVEADQSALGMWRSDIEAGVRRPTATKSLSVLKVGPSHGAQVAECLEEDGDRRWKVLLRGPECREGDRVQVFWPWCTLGESVLLCNRFLIDRNSRTSTSVLN